MNTDFVSLVHSAQLGNRNDTDRLLAELTPRIDQLIATWGLVKMGFEPEDMRQEALLAAYIAIYTWRENVPFEQHALTHVRRHLAKIIASQETPSLDLLPPAPSLADPAQTYLNRELLKGILSRLSCFQRRVCHGIFLAGHTPDELALSLGCQVKDVHAAIRSIRNIAKSVRDEFAGD